MAVFGVDLDAAVTLAACFVAAAFGWGFPASVASGFTGVVTATIGSLSAGFSGTVGGVGGVLSGDVGLGAMSRGRSRCHGVAGVGGVGVAWVNEPGG